MTRKLLVRVFGNTYLNPEAVGMVQTNASFDGDVRTQVTEISDKENFGVVAELRTKVTRAEQGSESNTEDFKRDNFRHAEIIAALNEGRDAIDYDKLNGASKQ